VRQRSRLIDVLDRAETGPIMEEADFERRLLAPAIKKAAEEHGIKFDSSNLVCSDDDLADRLFKAGMDVAVETGIFCQDTSRRIVFSRAEFEEALRGVAGEVTMGTGNDAVVARTRRPESEIRPILVGGAYGVPFPEDLFVPVMVSFAKEPVVDVIENPTLESVYGKPIKAASPWEVLGGWREAELALEVGKRVGRPGIAVGCVETSPTALAELSASSWGGFRPTDWHHVSTVSELKTNYDLLCKVAHIIRTGAVMGTYYNPIYGGYVGGAEGVAVAIVAGSILINQLTMADTISTRSDHPFLGCNTTPELMWAMSVGLQALGRNTNLLTGTLIGPAGGPGTKTVLYELAAYAVSMTASGVAVLQASHTAGGAVPRHVSGLEARMCGEVMRAAVGMSREEANQHVAKLYSLYGPELEKKPIGKPFEEVYDVVNVVPTAEWQGMYDEVRQELVDMGLSLDALV